MDICRVARIARTCTDRYGVHGYARLCTAMHGYARLRTAMHGYARTPHGHARTARTAQARTRIARIARIAQWSLAVCWCGGHALSFPDVLQSIQELLGEDYIAVQLRRQQQ